MRILFTSSFLQNRSLVCSCPWDHHARRLSLRDDPESHLKEDCIILFHKNQTQSRYFLSAYHLFVAYFASKCEVFFSKISLIFATKIYQAFIKNRTQLSLDLNQLVLQAKRKKGLVRVSERHQGVSIHFFGDPTNFFIRLSANILNVLHFKDAVKFKYQSWMYGRPP